MRNGQLSFLPRAERPQNEALPSDFPVYRIGFVVPSSEIGPRPNRLGRESLVERPTFPVQMSPQAWERRLGNRGASRTRFPSVNVLSEFLHGRVTNRIAPPWVSLKGHLNRTPCAIMRIGACATKSMAARDAPGEQHSARIEDWIASTLGQDLAGVHHSIALAVLG